jgi:membrane protein
MRLKDLGIVLKETAAGWYRHGTFELGAALAFYGVFALAPTLVIAIAVAGLIFGEEANVAQEQLVARLEQVVSPSVARAIAETLDYVYINRSGWVASAIGFGVLIFGIMAAFAQLQAALNAIWGVRSTGADGLRGMLRDRLMTFVLVVICWGLLFASLAASTVVSTLRTHVPWITVGEVYVWGGLNLLCSLALLTLLFAMIFKLLPDVKMRWRAAWVGAALTAVLFALGNYGIGLYLGRSASISAYGAAGSLVVVMLWVYYSSQVLLFGAEFTQHFAKRFGERVEVAENAERLVAERCEQADRRVAGAQRVAGAERSEAPAERSALRDPA